MPAYPRVQPESRAEWRAWLAVHHASALGAVCVFWKKATGHPTLTYGEAVEEALCVGWIDSMPVKIDAERHGLTFTPRKKRSGWSALNKVRIERLRAAGQMLPAGEAAIARAVADGSWTLLDDSEAMRVPDDFAAALDADPAVRAVYDRFPPSVRKAHLQQIALAKRPETRARRIAQIVEAAARGERFGFTTS